MDFLSLALELFRNADHFIFYIAENYGWWVYFVLFTIFFSETGLVIAAFLPGDSLLFISGAAAAAGALEVSMLILLIILGAILGNTLNYYIGSWLGNKIYDGSISWIDQSALQRTHDFYEKHGGKTIVLARFIPIVRSFAPLVAGAAKMEMGKFQLYNCTGAFLWVTSIVGAGYLFGNIPFIKNNLSLILILGFIAALVLLKSFATSA
ncbi:VTT domain-containing protein, partial [uncultured Parasutterella sp.]|uniref:VTT domain-containing protein n=1 Tax=uncultured Parasutterella sp. TaxID=1263098 RepID=UPI0025975F64